jgi:signal transduction histidine kinase
MNKPVVICVDDEPTVLESLKIDLKRILGDTCLIETAEDGNEALELFEELQQSARYDVALILADYLMPGIKGDELLRRVHAKSPRTLSVMISGQADLAAVTQVLRDSQLYRYIAKPWTNEELNLTVIEAVERYLRDRQLSDQTEQLQQLNSVLEQQVRERTEQLHQKMRELEKLNQLKDEFLHAVTHDLRTPVTGTLLVFKRLQKQDGESVSLPQELVRRMIESSDRQLKLLDLLLQVQLSDAQGVLLHRDPTNLGDLATAIVRDIDPILQDQNVTVHNLIPQDLPLLNIDSLQVSRVFENLINNAIKHNPPGIRLTLHAAIEGEQVRCSVEDNGIGIPEHDCEAMFQRYVQGNRSRRGVGVGLGLYLCRQIIQSHGGEIGVFSALNQGAKFWFTLPLAKL